MTIQQLAEQSAHLSHNYQVTSEVYFSFQRCSNDLNPLHTDMTFASSKGFNGIVMYGNILNAFVSHFIGMMLPTRNVMIQSQDISFHKPVYLGDLLTLESEVEMVSEAVGIIGYKFRFKRPMDGKMETVAKGHVQIGMLK